MTEEETILGEAMGEWTYDESIADDVTFREWAALRRPDLLPIIEKLPPPSRPIPAIAGEDDEI